MNIIGQNFVARYIKTNSWNNLTKPDNLCQQPVIVDVFQTWLWRQAPLEFLYFHMS